MSTQKPLMFDDRTYMIDTWIMWVYDKSYRFKSGSKICSMEQSISNCKGESNEKKNVVPRYFDGGSHSPDFCKWAE